MLRKTLLALTLFAEGSVFLLALLLARFYEIRLLPLTENFFRDILLGTLAALFPLTLFVLSLSQRAESIPLIGSLQKTMIRDIKGIFANATLLDIAFISLFAGFAEELLFRGVIQVKLGIFSASIIFGLLHFVTPAYAIITTIMGFYIGILFLKFESLLIPIQLHFLYDLGALIYLRYYTKME